MADERLDVIVRADTEGVAEPLLLLTLKPPPEPGQIVNVDGVRYRVLRILRWTGTVARLEIERVGDDASS